MTEQEKEQIEVTEEVTSDNDENRENRTESATDESGDESNDSVNSEIADLQEQVESLKSDLQRERAEFTNFRKRNMQEKLQQAGIEAGKLLSSLLPVLDSFDQLLAAGNSEGDLKSFVEGAGLIRKQLLSVFTDKGVEEYEPQGEPFDPEKMEALSVQESDDVESEVVSQVFQKGYLLQDKVIRPARVVVSRPKAKPSETNNENKNDNEENNENSQE